MRVFPKSDENKEHYKGKGYEKYTLEHHPFFYILQPPEANSNDRYISLHTEYSLIYNELKNNVIKRL